MMHSQLSGECPPSALHRTAETHMLNDDEIKALVIQGRTIEPAVAGDPALGDLTQLPGTWQNLNAFPGHGWNMIALPFMEPGNTETPDKPGEVGPFRLPSERLHRQLDSLRFPPPIEEAVIDAL
jgi:hypothetical protein